MTDILDRLKTAERAPAERFPGAVAVISRQTVLDAIDEIERLRRQRDAQETEHVIREAYVSKLEKDSARLEKFRGDVYESIVEHAGGKTEYAYIWHAVPLVGWNPTSNVAPYLDSYDVIRYDSPANIRAGLVSAYSIVSFTVPDDWAFPAGPNSGEVQ